MIQMRLLLVLCAVSVSLGGISVRRAGWLDRVIRYYRQQFLDDVQEVAHVQIQASLAPAPAGYVDSELWEYTSVARLLALLGASEAAAPVRLALRHALRPSHSTRRFISKQKSWNLFPSLGKMDQNDIYYDFESKEEAEETDFGIGMIHDNTVVVLQNPVEAHLPSARISISLLRKILEARALSARFMPNHPPPTYAWIVSKTNNGTKYGAEKDSEKTANKDGGDATLDKGGVNVAASGGDANTVGGSDAPATVGGNTTASAKAADDSTENQRRQVHKSGDSALDEATKIYDDRAVGKTNEATDGNITEA